MNGKRIAKKLHEIQNGISGATQSEVKEMLAGFGYTAERMAEGKALLDEVTRLMALQIDSYGDQYAASEQVSAEWDKAYADYMVVLKVVRVALKNNTDAIISLKATGRRSKSFSGWLREARILYINLLNDAEALATIQRYGITAVRLQNGLQQVDAVEAFYGKHLEKRGEAQQTTVDRDKAFDELTNWYSDFRAIARIALYEKPQLLEALGIVKK